VKSKEEAISYPSVVTSSLKLRNIDERTVGFLTRVRHWRG